MNVNQHVQKLNELWEKTMGLDYKNPESKDELSAIIEQIQDEERAFGAAMYKMIREGMPLVLKIDLAAVKEEKPQ